MGREVHRGWNVRKAAAELAEEQSLSPCPCGSPRVIEVTHIKPDESEDNYTVVRVARLFSDKDAEMEGYDPMGWVLREKDEGEVLQLIYWIQEPI